MMMRHTFDEEEVASTIEHSVESVLASGKRTQDIAKEKDTTIGTKEMGQEVLSKIELT
jgi:isocitrate/isopropylmalate dehydrogenase